MLRLFELALQDWRLALTLLSLLPPIFMTLHFVHYMCCTEFDEEEEQQAPQAQAQTQGKKKGKKSKRS